MIYAGAYEEIITPKESQFLFGYPHVERYSNGVHDPLMTSALYIDDGRTQILFITNDLIFVSKQLTSDVRNAIEGKLGIPGKNIMISATHTHSGPGMVNYASNTRDPIVPRADESYIRYVKEKMVHAAAEAKKCAEPATIGLVIADSTGIGTNRRDPLGPSNHEVPVLAVMDVHMTRYIACMLIVSMHPTVLHEDSRLISSDFIGMARKYLKQHVVDNDCVILTHNGPCGNQSPRHVVKENTFAEAERLGRILGEAVENVLPRLSMETDADLEARQVFLDSVPKREFGSSSAAKLNVQKVLDKIEYMRQAGSPSAEIRTVECDVFGAEEMVTLSSMKESGELEAYYESCLPVEIQLIKIGPWNFVGWSGEVFVEFALKVKHALPNTFVISLANGEMQGYITTKEAAEEGGYEASNALFASDTGELLVQKTLALCATDPIE